MIRQRIQLLAAAASLAITCATAAQESTAPLGSRENPLLFELPDSLLAAGVVDTTGEMAAFLVAGERIVRREISGHTVVGRSAVDVLDAGDVSELAPALGSTRMQVNSRGEALFSVRGAPERHVSVYLDGIPLVVPWDERADLSLLPLDAVGGVEARRGIHSVGDGPHGLAGRIDLRTQRLGRPGHSSRLSFAGGEAGAWEARAAHMFATRSLAWDGLLALSHGSRDGFLLPREADGLLHQSSGRRLRLNSAREQTAALASLRRILPRAGELRATVQWSGGDKEVPPEGHVNDARFWRYPDSRRLLAGLGGHVHLDGGQRWRLRAGYAADFFHQEIREYSDASYSDPAPASGDPFEEDDDLTHSARLSLRRSWENQRTLEWTAHGRWTSHRETLVVDGPEEEYSQQLHGLTGEWTEPLGSNWRVRLGGGYERAATPKTGDKPSKDPTDAPVALLALRRAFDSGQIEARVSRRSRFPSLRETFSGALDRFELNPDLHAEEQDLAELEGRWASSRLELGVGVFGSWVDGAIERIVSPNDADRFMRVNVGKLRVLGSELSVNWSPPIPGFTVGSRLALLHARIGDGDGYDLHAEDRPEFLASSSISYSHSTGLRLRLENVSVGERYGADASSAGGLVRLSPQTAWNVRMSYLLIPLGMPQSEVFVRLRNVLDTELLSQPGLPEPGRSLWAGLRLQFD